MTRAMTLAHYLAHAHQAQGCAPVPMQQLLDQVADACKAIASQVAAGALAGVLGAAGSENVQGEEQKKLDLIANETFITHCQWGGQLAAMASEEMEAPYAIPDTYPRGRYLLLFDPLDGSSNVDVNVSIGTIFSILAMPDDRTTATEQDFLQPGHRQVAAGYCVYGPQTTLVLTLGHGVAMFTLDRQQGAFLLTRDQVQIPQATTEFAINMSNMRHWAPPVRRYVDECLAGVEGPRGKNFNMRWIASMVADVHRILSRGGIFMYPWDRREPDRAGKLRLMYEANPMAWLVEQAGGAATNGRQRILDIVPARLHERVSVILGSRNEVTRVTDYHVQDPLP